MTIRILIADDHPLTRSGLAEWIKRNENFSLTAEVENGIEAWRSLQESHPDIALLDIQMPGENGITVAQRIKEASIPTRAIMLTSFNAQPYVMASLRAGARGFVLKTTAVRELDIAVKQVMNGGFYLDSKVAGVLGDKDSTPVPLSSREREVLLIMSKGFSIKEIAAKLCITERTVQAHLTSVYSKFCCRGKGEALLVALKHGIITLDELLEGTSLDEANTQC
ncbi:MAG: response regulator transcription factor [Synergistaceae bacterium]|jgi:DNA-binding NarL/FixJ family response regulator|nr:response regulator transcription factor [Synergistaceae bacterium]